jgi:4-hydroxybenzoate polyprenyltransferase
MSTSTKAFVRLARPQQWVKNVFVLLPLVFSGHAGQLGAWGQALLATAAFCLASGAAYAHNDIRDRDVDRLHPRKRQRPLPAGQVSVAGAGVLAIALAVTGLLMALQLNWPTAAMVGAYLMLQLVYSMGLKRKMLVDVMCIALGFVLRAVTGAVAIAVEPSPWLIICTFTLCLFIGFCKRRGELSTIGDSEAAGHRRTLAGYTPELLTHLITLSAGIAIMSFLLYSVSPETVDRFGSVYLAYTLPAVIYAICRMAMLSMWGRYDDPTDLFVRDRPFQITTAAWTLAVLVIVYGRPIFSLGASRGT